MLLNVTEQKVITGDCIAIMKQFPDNCFDSALTDPPYELGFMNKKWDNTGIAYNVEMWREVLRILKPGAQLLSFGGTRTYHRMACAIEDAGFEIRDQMQWIYGSGFPKSMDVAKAIDKKLNVQQKIIGVKNCMDMRGGDLMKTRERNDSNRILHNVTAPTSQEAIKYAGWGTALKPANEPICLARKPLSTDVAGNVLHYGTGGLNIDACKIERDPADVSGWSKTGAKESNNTCMTGKNYARAPKPDAAGRFPANVIFDKYAAQMLDEQTGILKSGSNCRRTKSGSFLEHGGLGKTGDVQKTYGDSGGASRFFYCAKASRKERDAGDARNIHPTVKPISLLRYLIRLIPPIGGTCIDPFIGSGTTAIAAYLEDFNCIGIENNSEYAEIARKRIHAIHEKGGLP